MEITLEKFFSRTKEADILITYRGPESGITSKEKMRRSSRLLQTIDIKPMREGRIFFTGRRLYQTADTAGIMEELTSILYPGIFPDHKEQKYFFELPEK